MVNRGMLVLGSILIVLGLLFMIGSIFRIDIGALCCPVGLILIGVFVIFRPSLAGQGAGPSNVVLIGDVKKKGSWQVQDAEYWVGVADIDLDMTQAEIPFGETRLRIFGFVPDTELRLPADVGVAVEGSGFVINTNLMGRKAENIFAPVEFRSDNYLSAERKIHVEIIAFVVELKVKRG